MHPRNDQDSRKTGRIFTFSTRCNVARNRRKLSMVATIADGKSAGNRNRSAGASYSAGASAAAGASAGAALQRRAQLLQRRSFGFGGRLSRQQPQRPGPQPPEPSPRLDEWPTPRAADARTPRSSFLNSGGFSGRSPRLGLEDAEAQDAFGQLEAAVELSDRLGLGLELEDVVRRPARGGRSGTAADGCPNPWSP